MTTFAVTSTDQTLDAVNYLLSNLNQTGNVGNVTIPTGTLIGNTTSGIVSTYNAGGGNAYSYLYQFINLRYANNATGTSGFSTLPGNANFFGVYNSTTSAASSVPAAYTFYQVAGGFGTTKTIFYSTQGGRQIQFVPANVAPSSSFIQSTANVAIDLDVVTTAAGTPGERGPIAMAYVVTPSTPVGASDLQLTAWWEAARDSATPPIGTGLTPVTGDTGTFIYGAGVGTPSETYEFNGSGWNEVVPQVISGNVIVANSLPSNSLVYQSLTNDQIASNTIINRTIAFNTITGNKLEFNTITANQIAANTITATNILTGTITATQIAANTITATQIAANTITANNIVSNYLYTGNIVSTGATLGSNTSTGYWLRFSDGAARFGGNVSIGNNAAIGSNVTVGGNLQVGANAVISSNLSVVGLVTAGSLNANTVSTTTININNVSQGSANVRTANTSIQIGQPAGTNAVLAGPASVVVTSANNAGYISFQASTYWTWTSGGTVYLQYLIQRDQSDGLGYQTLETINSAVAQPFIGTDTFTFIYYDANLYYPLSTNTITYRLLVNWRAQTGSPVTVRISSEYGAVVIQNLKR